MGNYFDKVIYISELFCGSGPTAVFCLMILLLMIKISDNKKLKIYIFYPILAELLFIFNPISINIFVNTGLLAETRYVRLFWLLQMGVLIASAACECFCRLQSSEKGMRLFLGILLSAVIILMGRYTFSKENYQMATNIYKLPDGVIEVTNVIRNACMEEGKSVSEVRIAVPVSLAPYIRQYDGNIKMLYGRNIENDLASASVQRLMQENELSSYHISFYAKEKLCDYVVLENNKPLTEPFEEYGYELVDVVKGYAVYRDITITENLLP